MRIASAKNKVWEVAEMGPNDRQNACPLSPVVKKFDQELHKVHKGFMCNAHSHTCLTNQALAEGLAYVQENILQGNKIDIVAFDTCMGNMLEVATCLPHMRSTS